MNLLSRLYKVTAAQMPRVRGFESRFYFGHPFLDAWFAWFPLNQLQYDGASVGEIYQVASRIDERKSESWILEWRKEAERVVAHAEAVQRAGHPFSAANAFLRAYTYYRTAHLATDPVNHPDQLQATYRRLSRCYARFAELSDVPTATAPSSSPPPTCSSTSPPRSPHARSSDASSTTPASASCASTRSDTSPTTAETPTCSFG